jgi:hypothetical protein
MAYIGNNLTVQQYAPTISYLSGNGSTTVFTLPIAVVSAAQIIVSIENVIQNPSSAFTVSGSTITFTSAPPSGTNNIWVEYTSLQTNLIQPAAGTVSQTSFASITGTGATVLQTSPTIINPTYTGTFTGGTGVVNLGSGQFYKDASGNVGIGTTSPSKQVEISNVNEARFGLTSTGTNGKAYELISTGGSTGIGQGNLAFYDRTTAAVRMNIDANGYVSIGTSTAAAPFTVEGTTGGGTAWFKHNGGNSFGTILVLETTAGTDDPMLSFKNYNGGSPTVTGIRGIDAGGIAFMNGGGTGGFGGTIGNIFSTGGDIFQWYTNRSGSGGYFYYNTSGNYGSTSDSRVKNSIETIDPTEALAFVNKLKPASFKMNGDDKIQAGFIAQDILNSAQNDAQQSAVDKVDTYDETDPDCPYLGLSDRPILAHAIAAIQAQQAIIEDLKTRIETLEAK